MIVAFDIDDTLYKIEYEDGKPVRQVPDHDLIPVLRWFASNGDTVLVWSAGGMSYAEQIVQRLGIASLVRVVRKGQPGVSVDLTFDDMVVVLGKVNCLVNRGKSVEELYGGE